MEDADFVDLEGFDVEMGEYEVVQTQKFDRYMRIETGGSVASAPLVVDSVLYFASMNHNVYALDAVTGEEIWRFETRDRIGGSGPVYSNGMIFVGSYDHNLYCLDAKTGELVWKFRTEGPIYCRVETYKENVYAGSKDYNLYAINANTGELSWKFKTSGEIASMPTAYNDSIFIGSYDHSVYRLDSESGKLLKKYTTQGEVHNVNRFLVHNGVIHVASTDNILRAFNIEDGFEVWKTRVANYGLSSSPVRDGDRMYLGTRDGDIICLDFDGKTFWRFRTNEVVHAPLIKDDVIYFGSGNKLFYCLDKAEGKMVWSFQTNGSIVISPFYWEGRIYFGCWDCHVYCLDISGNLIWKFRTEGEPSYKPPAYESFEMKVNIDEEEVKEIEIKRYKMEFKEETESNSSVYRTEATYQMGSTYVKKGKYAF